MAERDSARADQSMRHPIWNDYIAPGIAQIERQTIPSISKKIDPDPLQFVITSMLLSIPKSNRVRAFNFIRRSSDALSEYRRARRAYYKFFGDRLPHVYLEALHHFESCLACAYQGHELLFGMTGQPFFDKAKAGRAELNYRMQRLYNSSKHTEGFVKSSAFVGDTVTMWISNAGLETRKETMSFDELGHIVSDMSFAAWIMAKSYIWRGSRRGRNVFLNVTNTSFLPKSKTAPMTERYFVWSYCDSSVARMSEATSGFWLCRCPHIALLMRATC